MRKQLSFVLAIFFLVTTLIQPFAHAKQGTQIIQSSYLTNGITYWNSSWNTQQKNTQHALNLDKALRLIESVREGLTCIEKNLNAYEKYYCSVETSSRNDEANTSAKQPSTLRKEGKIVLSTLTTIFSLVVADTILRMHFFNKMNNYLSEFIYFTPYDQMILSSDQKISRYIKTYTGEKVISYTDFPRSRSLSRFFENIGFDIRIHGEKPFNIELIKKTSGKEVPKKFMMTENMLGQAAREISELPWEARRQYVDALFLHKGEFFLTSPDIREQAQVDELKRSIRAMAETKEMKRVANLTKMDRKWHESKSFRRNIRLSVAGGILLIGAGTLWYFLSDNFSAQSYEPFEIDDLPTLTDYVLNTNPILTAQLAMTFDEIPVAITDSNKF
jgi:hypothetical protein